MKNKSSIAAVNQLSNVAEKWKNKKVNGILVIQKQKKKIIDSTI